MPQVRHTRLDFSNSLSPLGRSMEPGLAALKKWSDTNIGLFAKPGDALSAAA